MFVFLNLLAVTILLCCGVKPTAENLSHPKLLVVSYDAFRYDYFERNITPFMSHLKKEGTNADYMKNIFITKTFPNHHTMATGLYAETHGVVDNDAFNPKTNKSLNYSYELFHQNSAVIPIWSVNEKGSNGRHSGEMMWPGSSYEYNGTNITFTHVYNRSVPWKERVDELISWFIHPSTPINFGLLYIEEPDFTGHGVGIHGPIFDGVLKKLDNITKYLHDELERHNLSDVNVIHLSDHGMVGVRMDRIINLTLYIESSDYDIIGTNPVFHIVPKPNKFDLIYQNLKKAAEETEKFVVYKREEIPKKYHYGNNERVGPILIVAKLGYGFQTLLGEVPFYEKEFNVTINDKSEFGAHGYDNEAMEMHPFFFAKGPAFIPRCKLEPFDNVDLVPLFCDILQLKCPPNNGTLEHTKPCLTAHSQSIRNKSSTALIIGVVFLISIIGILGAVSIFLIRRRRRATTDYRNAYTAVIG